jgi:hypothetical protein
MQTLTKKGTGDDIIVEAPISVMEMIRMPGVAYALFLYGHVMLLGLAYTAGTSQHPAPFPPGTNIYSNAGLLVYTPISRWLRLYPITNIPLPRKHWRFTSYLASSRLSSTPGKVHYSWRAERLLYCLAHLLRCCASWKLALAKSRWR